MVYYAGWDGVLQRCVVGHFLKSEIMKLAMFSSLLGGIGLFLLGMWLMTDGLKLAAGKALRNLLARFTDTPMRGLASGALITGLVQSSSAVTVATIGFVNAGLMELRRAVMVIYGSNVGTTMTGWLVALVGLNMDVKAFALPAVGVGMFLRIGTSGRRAATGQAIAGFGIFFLGIDLLEAGFSGIGGHLDLAASGSGALALLTFTGAGFLLTLFMQSSSAALAVVLTAASGGVVPLGDAAAMVIGANVGTTSTAALAVIGATANAKRVAAAHVVFNFLTAVVALVLLPALVFGLVTLRQWFAESAEPAVVLALFHTCFNILGVVLMWPLSNTLVTVLERRFLSVEEDESRPHYLDRNLAGTPTLALHAMVMELVRVTDIARRLVTEALSSEQPNTDRMQTEQRVLIRLVDSIGDYGALIQRNRLPPELDSVLPDGLRVSRYASEMAELAGAVALARADLPSLQDAALRGGANQFQGQVAAFLEHALPSDQEYDATSIRAKLEVLEAQYQELKSAFLRAAPESRIAVRPMVEWLDMLSNIRRSAGQTYKAGAYLDPLMTRLSQGRP